MKIGGRTWMSLALMLIAAGVFLTAMQWPLKAAIFPMTIAVFVFVLATMEVFLGIYLKQDAKEESTMDFKLAGAEDADIDEATANKRVVNISLWMLLFFIIILIVGFPAAIPIFFIVFLRLYGKESWTMSIVLSAVAWGCFYGLFMWMLHIPFPEGWLFRGLRALGMF